MISLWELAGASLQLLLVSTFSAEATHSSHVPLALSSSCLLPPFPPVTLGMTQTSLSLRFSLRFFLCFNFYPSNTFFLFCFLFPFQSIIINIGELWVLYQFCHPVVLSLSILLRLFWFFSLVCHWGFGAPLHMLMTATSCAAQKIPLIYKFPRASLPMNNPVAPAPGWVCKALNDGFVQGTTTKHLRGDRWEAYAESFILPDACTNPLPIPTLTPSEDEMFACCSCNYQCLTFELLKIN